MDNPLIGSPQAYRYRYVVLGCSYIVGPSPLDSQSLVSLHEAYIIPIAAITRKPHIGGGGARFLIRPPGTVVPDGLMFYC